MTVCVHCPIPRLIFCLSALLSIAPHHWRMLLTRWVPLDWKPHLLFPDSSNISPFSGIPKFCTSVPPPLLFSLAWSPTYAISEPVSNSSRHKAWHLSHQSKAKMSPNGWEQHTPNAVVRRCAVWTKSSPRPLTRPSQSKNKAGQLSNRPAAIAATIAPAPCLQEVEAPGPARRLRSALARFCRLILLDTLWFSFLSWPDHKPGCFVGLLARSPVYVTCRRKLDKARHDFPNPSLLYRYAARPLQWSWFFFIFAGGCFFYFTFVPCLCSFWPFSRPLSPLFHLMSLMTSGLCRFPLACMGLVFSIMLSDMFCWRKRRPMCYWIHLTFCVYQCLPRRIRVIFSPGKCNPNFEWYIRKEKEKKSKTARRRDPSCRPKCKPSLHDCRVTLVVFTLYSRLTRITLPTNLPLPIAIACLRALFFRPAHKVLKLGPESFHRSKFIAHLITPLADALSPSRCWTLPQSHSLGSDSNGSCFEVLAPCPNRIN